MGRIRSRYLRVELLAKRVRVENRRDIWNKKKE